MNSPIARRVINVIAGLSEICLAAVVGIVAVGMSITALMHSVDPSHYGLWVSHQMFMFGVMEDPTQAREVLGETIYLYAATVALVSVPFIKELVHAALRRCVRQAHD